MDETPDRDELIRRYMKLPSKQRMSDGEWELHVDDALVFGCDWLEHLQHLNPMPASAVEAMALRIYELEQYVGVGAMDIYGITIKQDNQGIWKVSWEDEKETVSVQGNLCRDEVLWVVANILTRGKSPHRETP
jgi:hypothetical protein